MSIITAKNLSYSIGIETILDDVNFNVNAGDRVGIVGVNGAGKSTLLKLLVGDLTADEGDLWIAKGASLGYLKQREHFDEGQSVMDVMMNVSDEVKKAFEESHHYAYERAAAGLLTAMRFDESYFGRDVGLLSGGEKTRLALCALLVREPDILLLDEPTNHLDLPMLKWLENYLKGYRGTLLIVSHDRYFLDKCVNRIFEIENCTLNSYSGNYSSYKEQKQRNYEIDMKHYLAQMEEIKRQEELISRWKQRGTEHLTKRAKSREKRLAHIVPPVKPTQLTDSLKLCFDEKLSSGNDVVTMMDLSFGYGNSGWSEDVAGASDKAPAREKLFKNVNLDIKKGDRVCIVGENGVGKTTLLKMLLGEYGASGERIMPQTGRVILGVNVMPGYYDQEQKSLTGSRTVLDELHSSYIKYNETELRKVLGSFLFRGDDVFKHVSELAGGEKARLALLKLMMSGSNLLIFDEPTNHLDISAKEIFEEAIMNFPGTVIIVSHDRYLLSKVPSYICELTPNGVIKYPGKFDFYEEHREEYTKAAEAGLGFETSANGKKRDTINDNGFSSAEGAQSFDDDRYGLKPKSNAETRQETWEQKKAREREERKAQKEKQAAEDKVMELEGRIEELEEQISQPAIASNPAKLSEIAALLDAAKTELDEAMEKWLALE